MLDLGRNQLRGDTGRGLGLIRLAIGLIQGAVLWWLLRSVLHGQETWPANQPLIFAPLLLVALFLPVVLLGSVGRLKPVVLAIWALVVALALVLLGWHDVARKVAESLRHPPYLSPVLVIFSAAALFIAHHLISPIDWGGRRKARYPDYFDTAWKAGVQLVLSFAFVGAFWLLLVLGAQLFQVIGVKALSTLLSKDWFSVPVTTLVFAVAVHLTDVRDGLIRGVRTVALMLLSWLLLLMTGLTAAFLAALPFTGLNGLWQTGSSTALVLSAAAILIVLINAAYQDGAPDNRPPVVLRWAVQVASVLLVPLIGLAVWGLALRIGQHGLTPDRIVAVACALVGAGYAGGYAFAALWAARRRGEWMAPLERTNVWTGVLAVAVILALFSPLADPARLSVAHQVARLEAGAIAPEKFDYAFLRFHGERAGNAALARLARSSNPEIARRARESLAEPLGHVSEMQTQVPDLDVWPQDARVPRDFLDAIPDTDLSWRCDRQVDCLATARDLDGDGADEILVADRASIMVFARVGDSWLSQGTYRAFTCNPETLEDSREALKRIAPVAPRWPALRVDGRTLQFSAENNCPARAIGRPPSPPVKAGR